MQDAVARDHLVCQIVAFGGPIHKVDSSKGLQKRDLRDQDSGLAHQGAPKTTAIAHFSQAE
jgi:hypothetical protein